jgi:hypothetical protein
MRKGSWVITQTDVLDLFVDLFGLKMRTRLTIALEDKPGSSTGLSR